MTKLEQTLAELKSQIEMVKLERDYWQKTSMEQREIESELRSDIRKRRHWDKLRLTNLGWLNDTQAERMAELKERNKLLEETNSKLNLTIQGKDREIRDLENENYRLSFDYKFKNNQKEIVELENRVKVLREANSSLNEIIQAYQRDVLSFKDEIKELKNKNQKLEFLKNQYEWESHFYEEILRENNLLDTIDHQGKPKS